MDHQNLIQEVQEHVYTSTMNAKYHGWMLARWEWWQSAARVCNAVTALVAGAHAAVALLLGHESWLAVTAVFSVLVVVPNALVLALAPAKKIKAYTKLRQRWLLLSHEFERVLKDLERSGGKVPRHLLEEIKRLESTIASISNEEPPEDRDLLLKAQGEVEEEFGLLTA